MNISYYLMFCAKVWLHFKNQLLIKILKTHIFTDLLSGLIKKCSRLAISITGVGGSNLSFINNTNKLKINDVLTCELMIRPNYTVALLTLLTLC